MSKDSNKKDKGFLLTLAVVVGIMLVVGALFFIFWPRGVDNFGVVVPGKIYRSGQPTDDEWENLIKTFGLRTVLSLRRLDEPQHILDAEKEACARFGVRLVIVPMYGDGIALYDEYDQALAVLADPALHPVLVHCARGAFRTGAVIALYRVRAQGWGEEEVVREMRAYRFFERKERPLLPHLKKYLYARKNRILSVDIAPSAR